MGEETGQGAAFLEVRNLTKKFGAFTALKDISLDVAEKEFICFLGPSGCGKTTFLRAIAGLDIHTSGAITQAGRDISNLPPSERDFGIVFQSYALFPNLTVKRNIAYGLENAKGQKDHIANRVDELLNLVGLPDQGDKYPAQLSGGQQQRIALARALATSPGLLLLDEPLSALDARVRSHLRHEIKILQEKLGVTTIMVTHDQEEALTMADRIVVMNQGTIEQVGTPLEIYREPATLFVADFVGEMNKIPGSAVSKGTVRIGEILLHCASTILVKGAQGTVTIRPEDIMVVSETSGVKSKNAIDVTISQLEFLGSFWRARLMNEKLGEAPLIADFSVDTVRRMSLEEGSAIKIGLPSHALRFFESNG